MNTTESSLLSLAEDPSPLIDAPVRLCDRALHYLSIYESPQLALSVLENLPGAAQNGLRERRVDLLCSVGRTKEAVDLARHHVALRPSATASCLLAKTLFRAGDGNAALELMNNLAKEHGDLITVWGTLGDLHLAMENIRKAEDCFDKVLQLRPDSNTGVRGMARCALEAGDLSRARGLFDSVMDTEGTFFGHTLLTEAVGFYEHLGDHTRVSQLQEDLAKLRQTAIDNLAAELHNRARGLPAKPKPVSPTTGKQSPGKQKAKIDPWTKLERDDRFVVAPAPGVGIKASASSDIRQLLRDVFGHDSFRPGQEEVIQHVLQGHDTLAVMPTGSGKSLCYQLPALALPGLTLVISPLIALMKDQMDSLPPSLAEKATFINSTLDRDELDQRLAEIASGSYSLVYAAPERLRQRHFLHAIRRSNISLLVVDEAHCVSMWGHDFRPDYLFIAKAVDELGNPALLAMTATATPDMAEEIAGQFSRRLHLVRTSMHRPNLHLEVQGCRNNDDKMRALVEICRNEGGTGIVYVNAREKAERLAELLRRKARISAEHYHAEMGRTEREEAQNRFMDGSTRVMVATIAFGMGIDKENVRFIIHFDLPRSLEGYSQEVGRAGRDGKPARCILLYTSAAKGLLTRWANEDQMSVEELRSVYRAVREEVRSRGVSGHAPIVQSDIVRALVDAGGEGSLESRARVAISLLQRAGLLVRHFDLPRVSMIALRKGAADATDEEFRRFVEAQRLPAGRKLEIDTLEAAELRGISPEQIEGKLLHWQQEGWLSYRGIGREIHIQLLDAPANSREKLEELLETRARKQKEQIEQIGYFAEAFKCRHTVLASHFGETLKAQCHSCDCCAPGRRMSIAPKKKTVGMDNEPQVRQTVVACLKSLPNAVGKRGLISTLRGGIDCPLGAERTPQYGALAHLSKDKLRRYIESFVEDGTLEAYERDGFPLIKTGR